MVDTRTNFSKHMINQIKETFGEHVLSTVIHQTVAVRESQAKGVPLVKHDPKSKGALDYLLLSQEIVNKSAARAEAEMSGDRLAAVSGRLKDFLLEARGAREVHLVGDFNNWSVSTDSLLWQKEEGVWQKRIFLDPGRYRYKFVVDGEWATDPSNQHLESNPYGGVDSVLDIE